MIMPTFNLRILESFVEVFVRQSEIMVQQMEFEPQGNEIDVFKYVSLCTLDIICGNYQLISSIFSLIVFEQ